MKIEGTRIATNKSRNKKNNIEQNKRNYIGGISSHDCHINYLSNH